MFFTHVNDLVLRSRRIEGENLTYNGDALKEMQEGIPGEYHGLDVKSGFGIGNWGRVTWIGFVTAGQKIQNGIYPVYLYYRKQGILILAYGISETSGPQMHWPSNGAQTVQEFFRSNGLGDAPKYKKSLVFKAYDMNKIERLDETADQDLDQLIEYYKSVMSGVVPQISTSPVMSNNSAMETSSSRYTCFINAFMTKPFVLLAGISGTGKSQIVRKFAQATDNIDSINDDKERWSIHKPSNFEIIQVKPNWHNSLDVVGYKSNINGEHYEFTPFVEFIAKAWIHPKTPFFLCLDEMNLAPVEQYFAEYLSAIESRSYSDGKYETDPIIKPFNEFEPSLADSMINHLLKDASDDQRSILEDWFRNKGLTLPENLIVMGTVNMDETTCSFSRKVLDRAMSIEMNEVDFSRCLKPSNTDNPPILVEKNNRIVNRPIKSVSVIEGNAEADGSILLLTEDEAKRVVDYLVAINNLLEGTPFKLGYRACNEALLYVRASKENSKDKDYIESALDEFTNMKILSRIEGDESKLAIDYNDSRISEILSSEFGVNKDINILSCLKQVIKQKLNKSSISIRKIDEMLFVLRRDHFVSYWG